MHARLTAREPGRTGAHLTQAALVHVLPLEREGLQELAEQAVDAGLHAVLPDPGLDGAALGVDVHFQRLQSRPPLRSQPGRHPPWSL